MDAKTYTHTYADGFLLSYRLLTLTTYKLRYEIFLKNKREESNQPTQLSQESFYLFLFSLSLSISIFFSIL